MKDGLLKKVNAWADKNGVLKPKTTVVAGISGGADSVCLLHVLLLLSHVRLFSVFAVHVNHMIRGAEAEADESFVRELCRSWQIPLRVFREDAVKWARENGCSLEEAGRAIRYRCLYQVLQEEGAQYIAVAHHNRDQAETVFLNLLRGSGLDGLCGMEDVRESVIRPLLGTGKEEIERYIGENHLLYRTDSSNLENDHTRNKIRNVLFPKISEETGHAVISSLLRTAALLKTDRDYLLQSAHQQYRLALLAEGETEIVFNRSELIRLHPAMSSRVIRIAWSRITGSYKGLEVRHVNAALDLAGKKETGKVIELPQGIKVKIEYDRFIMAKVPPQTVPGHFRIQAVPPSEIEIPGRNIRIITRLYSIDEYIKNGGDLGKAKETAPVQLFDYGRIKKGINIRSRLPGDIFHPWHSAGRKKLKEFFIDVKMPREERDRIPLLTDGKNIIWIIGLRTSNDYRITEATDTILYAEAVFDRSAREIQ